MNEKSRKHEALPKSEVVQLIDFDEASSGLIGVNEFGEALLSLDVAGTKPYMNMRIELEPLTYVTRPEYWGIEVVGRGPERGTARKRRKERHGERGLGAWGVMRRV